MLASCPPQAVGQHEEQGSCGEIEDFVKSFIPSLFDSDSDSEDAFYPQAAGISNPCAELPNLSKPLTITPSEHCAVGKADPFSEASSPSSQGTSSLSTFRPPLDSSGSIDDQSTFQSMLSIASNTTAIDTFLEEERPAKRAKASPSQGLQCVTSPHCSGSGGVEAPCIKAEPLSSTYAVSCTQGMPRPASLQCLNQLPSPPAATKVATGQSLPQPRSASPSSNQPWTPPSTVQQSKSCSGFPGNPGPWPAPQSMIPTAPMTAFYQQQGATLPPQLPAAASSPECISAALDRVASNLSAKPPLGLKLDKVGIMRQINETGMRIATP